MLHRIRMIDDWRRWFCAAWSGCRTKTGTGSKTCKSFSRKRGQHRCVTVQRSRCTACHAVATRS